MEKCFGFWFRIYLCYSLGIFGFFRDGESGKEVGFWEYDFYCIPFEIVGFLSFCVLLFVFREDEKSWVLWEYLYCVIRGDLNFFRLSFCCCVFYGWCTEDERDWNEYFGFIRDFYCTCFQIFEFLSLFAYIFWRWRDWIEYFEFSISIFFIKEHFND